MRALFATLVCLTLVATAQAQPRFRYVIVPQGVQALNDNGELAGAQVETTTGRLRAFIATTDGGFRWMAPVSNLRGVAALNQVGQVLGEVAPAPMDSHAPVLLTASRATILGGMGHWHGLAINDSGLMGGYSQNQTTGRFQPCLAFYNPPKSWLWEMTQYASSALGGQVSRITENGWVSGYFYSPRVLGNMAAFFYNATTRESRYYENSNGHNSAHGVNSYGWGVGQVTDDSLMRRATLFYPTLVPVPEPPYLYDVVVPLSLGTLSSVWETSVARSINDNTEVVGQVNGSGALRGFYWSWATGRMSDLNSLTDDLFGRTITDARSINRWGQILVKMMVAGSEKTAVLIPV